MEVSLLAHEVSDICLGKPALKSLPVSATVADALSALKRSGETFLSVWSCDCGGSTTTPAKIESGFDHEDRCRCIDKVCMVDVVAFLCSSDDNLKSPSNALQSPLSALLPGVPGRVRHLQPNSSLLEAIDLILEGAQNLVVPIGSPTGRFHARRKLVNGPSTLHAGREFCWLTQEDVLRFLLNSIAAFSPTPAFSIQSLGLIDPIDGLTVHYLAPASSALHAVARSLIHQTSVAVVDDDTRLLGEISPLAAARCDETAAGAVAALSAGDLMAYIDCGGSPPEDLVEAIKARLEEKKLGGMIELMDENGVSSAGSSSSDEEFGLLIKRAGSGSRAARGSEAIVCFPWSSLVAVMIQALAHRVNCVWVVEDDYSLVGMVTFAGILKVLREHI